MRKQKICLRIFLPGVFVLILLALFMRAKENPFKGLRINGKRLEQRILELAEFGKNDQGGVNRVAFSDADIQGRDYLRSLMKEAGLKIRTDEAGNIIGRREGLNPELPPILFGSHSDSVPDGGIYDGALGVLGAIECVQTLEEKNIITRHPLEVIIFTDEEGGLIGSKALIGTLTEGALEVISHSGKTVEEGITAVGGSPDKLANAIRKKGGIKAFIEIHIEQGKVLESRTIDIGVVEGIVGINWWEVTVDGFSNHAGTTPMNMRQDALLAAAHLIIAVNRVVTSIEGGQVGTVGRIRAEPGAPNVIPGKVIMSLELRDLEEEKIDRLYKKIREEARVIEKKTGTLITFSPIEATAVPALTDPRIQKYIMESARELGLTSLLMPSGAGHDAQNMARIAPTGMIFAPSVGGISHSPKEYTRPEDMENGVNVLLHTILKIDQSED
ncbi:MAG: Zn-dependent hydrolase [Candidatus Aminicenantes bacterium]|jgi:N-carbamoyl-L-amino-acid hydrolase